VKKPRSQSDSASEPAADLYERSSLTIVSAVICSQRGSS
jgi:hypothetical protein